LREEKSRIQKTQIRELLKWCTRVEGTHGGKRDPLDSRGQNFDLRREREKWSIFGGVKLGKTTALRINSNKAGRKGTRDTCKESMENQA